MIGAVMALVFGLGVYLLYDGLTNPRPLTGDDGAAPPMRDFLVRAGLRDVTLRDLALFSVGAGLALALVAHIALGWPLVTVLAFAAGLLAPLAYYVRRHDQRRVQVQVALVEAISQLRDAIRAGLSVQEALSHLARTGPPTLRPEFLILAREMRLVGAEEALTAMRDRLADPLFDVVAATLILNDRLGGRHVSQVLDRLAHATRAELRIQEEMRAYQAQTVLSARVIALMPVIVLIAIRQVNPRYLAVFDDPWGQAILGLCFVSIAVGYASMLWLTRMPADRRILR